MAKTRIDRRAFLVGALLCGLLVFSGCRTEIGPPAVETRDAQRTALDRYVEAPDPHFSFRHVQSIPGQGYAAHLLDLTSQSWLQDDEVDRNLWRHRLTIVQPEGARSDTALLLIGGGANDGSRPSRVDPLLHMLAQTANSVVAELGMVPNQPLTFAGDRPRHEDDLIAYTWDRFLRTGDERWPARLPMTKSAVRAMDAVTSFMNEQGVAVSRFVVAGASKRGWTTWTTAAVDERVVAIVPLVIDLLNVQSSFVHHYRAYGFWAPAIADYERMDIMRWMRTPEFGALMRIEDPYEYRERLTMPKYIVNSTGDEFFLPDSWQFYYDDLLGEKHLRYVPNTNHSLRGSDAVESVAAFYASVLRGEERPRYDWRVDSEGRILVRSETAPREVRLWQASNPEARDFRLDTLGAGWTSSFLTPGEDGEYVGDVPSPSRGWTAYFVEMNYDGFMVTSGVWVKPERLPYEAP
jgi:PhoPQ-activated pathogenicity-related protein